MIYRIRQFFQGIFAKIDKKDMDLLNEYLSKEEKDLFLQLSISEQRHCLNVAYGCIFELPNNKLLVRAAILHDVGKIRSNLSLINKALIVIALGLNVNDKYLPNFLKQALHFKLNHPEIAYEILTEIITDNQLLMLVKNHHTPEKFQTQEMDLLIHFDNMY